MHAEGKTDEARADLARLAIIKQQRADAAKRREDEKKGTILKFICYLCYKSECSTAVDSYSMYNQFKAPAPFQ